MIPEHKFHELLEKLTNSLEQLGEGVPEGGTLEGSKQLEAYFIVGMIIGSISVRGSQSDLADLLGVLRVWKMEAIAEKFKIS